MEKLNRKQTALITGASGGIGEDLARLFAADGYHLVLVARSRGKLERLAAELAAQHHIEARVIAADLSRPEAPAEIAAELDQARIEIDALVNNAGIGVYGAFAETDGQSELDLIQINVVALTQLTKLLLPGMVARKHGRILNVASTAAFQPGPLMAVYYASKAFVLSLSEALANELGGTGVTVTALCPGATQTAFFTEAKMGRTKLANGSTMSSAKVAQLGYRALMKGKTVVVTGMKNRLLAQSVRFMPRNVVTRIVRNVQGLQQNLGR